MLRWLKQLQVNSSMHQWFRIKKDALFLPFAKGLHKLGVSANTVTILGGLVGLCAIPLLWVNYWLFVVVAALSLCLDGVDGSLARFTKTQNQSGARLDYMVDIGLMFLMVSGLALWLQQPIWVVGINWHAGLLLLNKLLASPIKIAPGRFAFIVVLLINRPEIALAIYLAYAAVLSIAIPTAWYKQKVSLSQL